MTDIGPNDIINSVYKRFKRLIETFDLGPEDITDGPLLRGLLVLSVPLLVQNVVLIFQQVIDLFWVGRLSSGAVAAVGLTIPIIALIHAVGTVLPSVGTQVLVSQRVGAEDESGAQRAMGTGLIVGIVLSLIVGAVMFIFARPLIGFLLGTQPKAVSGDVIHLAVTYFSVIALGLWVTAISDTVEDTYMGWGDSRMVLYMGVVALGIGILLDPILIFGFDNSPLFEPLGLMWVQSTLLSLTGFTGIGIAGAALANIIGFGAGGLLGLVFIARGRNGGMLSWTAVRIDLGEIRELIGIGAPAGGQLAAKHMVELVLVLIAFRVGGPAGVAAYIVGFRVAAVAVVPSGTLGRAAQSMVGQNLGAGLSGRARRITWLGAAVSAGTLFIIGAIQWMIPHILVNLFVPTLSANATTFAVQYLMILAYGYPALGALPLFQAGFNGARRTQTTLVASLLQYWGVRLPIAAIGGLFLAFEMSAVFWAITLSNIIAAIGLAGYYYYSTADGMLNRAVETAAAD